MTRLLLLGRPECHLCEEFLAELQAHLGAAPVNVEQVCVDDRPEWQEQYGREIPVLLSPEGLPICRTHFDPQSLARYLQQPTG